MRAHLYRAKLLLHAPMCAVVAVVLLLSLILLRPFRTSTLSTRACWMCYRKPVYASGVARDFSGMCAASVGKRGKSGV